MGVMQRKKDGTEVISVRVPTAIKAKLVELRRCAHLLGFNFSDAGWDSERGGETDPRGTGQGRAKDWRCGADEAFVECGREGGVEGRIVTAQYGGGERHGETDLNFPTRSGARHCFRTYMEMGH
jgi:hypothetical protein